jgi:hypothetical protein
MFGGWGLWRAGSVMGLEKGGPVFSETVTHLH